MTQLTDKEMQKIQTTLEEKRDELIETFRADGGGWGVDSEVVTDLAKSMVLLRQFKDVAMRERASAIPPNNDRGAAKPSGPNGP